jgi:N-acyl-D-amino-acid deacylase
VEKMVAKITGDNAKAYGLTDRGVLAVGKRADINVMNFDRLGLSMPQMVHDLPSGGARLDQPATGFIATVLNGTITRDNDEDTGERPGRVIRGAA